MSDAVQPSPDQPDSLQADDETIERLRRAVTTDAVVWGDDEPEDDPAIATLLAVLRDVVALRPVEEAPLAAVLPLRRRPMLVRGSAVAACALGLLSIGGLAAASPGSPLYGVRAAVSSAVSSVVDAVTPSGPAAMRSLPALQLRPTHPPSPASAPTRRPPTPALGAVPSLPPRPTGMLPTTPTGPIPTIPTTPTGTLPTTPTGMLPTTPTGPIPTIPTGTLPVAPPPARTVGAARLVAALLDRAQAHLTAGGFIPAGRLLDLAERRLPEVALQDGRAGLASRLATLRAIADQGAASRAGQPKVSPSGPPATPGAKQGREPAAKDPKPAAHVTPAPGQPGGPATTGAKPQPAGRP